MNNPTLKHRYHLWESIEFNVEPDTDDVLDLLVLLPLCLAALTTGASRIEYLNRDEYESTFGEALEPDLAGTLFAWASTEDREEEIAFTVEHATETHVSECAVELAVLVCRYTLPDNPTPLCEAQARVSERVYAALGLADLSNYNFTVYHALDTETLVSLRAAMQRDLDLGEDETFVRARLANIDHELGARAPSPSELN